MIVILFLILGITVAIVFTLSTKNLRNINAAETLKAEILRCKEKGDDEELYDTLQKILKNNKRT